LLTAASAQKANSAVIFFTDFNSFNEVTKTTVVENFESSSLTIDTFLPPFVSNGNTYTGFAGQPFPNVYIVPPSANSAFLFPITSNVLSANGDEDFTVDFGSPTRVLGFDTYLNGFGPATVQVFGNSGLLDTFSLSHDPTTVGFLGIVADEPVTSIRWTTVNGGIVNTGIDNIRQGTVLSASVPEPSTILGSSIALGFGTFLKRKPAKSKESNKQDN
jgi:hypothetical protein